jgi:transcriptional regulator with XRE-family HTH domain
VDAVDSIGKRIAEYRKLRGWNQRQLAQRVGYSVSLVEKIERGVRGVERYSTIHAFAQALGVDVSELTGEFRRAGKQREHAAIPEIRRIVTAMPHGIEDGPVRPISELRRDVESAIARRESGRYRRFGEDFPALVQELSRATPSGADDIAEIQGLLAETLHGGSMLLRRLGYVDLSWVAIQRARAAALLSRDPLLVVANDWHITEFYFRTGNTPSAQRLTEDAIRRLEADHLSSQAPARAISLAGTFHLLRAMAAAQRTDRQEVEDAIGQASRAAERNGRDRDDYQSQFGPSNVDIFSVSTAVEMGDGELAARRARRVDTDAIPSRERQARYLIDVGRAYAQTRTDAAALGMIAEAHKRAPEYVANHVMAREVVAQLLERERRSVTPGLRTLAKKLGVA